MSSNKIIAIGASLTISGYLLFNYFKWNKLYDKYKNENCMDGYVNAKGEGEDELNWYQSQIVSEIKLGLPSTFAPLNALSDKKKGIFTCRYDFLNENFGFEKSFKKQLVQKLI